MNPIFAVLFTLHNSSSRPIGQTPQPDRIQRVLATRVTSSDISVLDAAFRWKLHSLGNKVKGLVFQRETIVYRDLKGILSFQDRKRRQREREVVHAFDDFARRNATP